MRNTIGEMRWKLLKQPGGVLRVYVTSVQVPPDKLLRDARQYEERCRKDLACVMPVERVDFYFDSCGGSVNSAQGMLSAVYRWFGDGKVPGRVLIDGNCGSAATIVAFGLNDVPVYITERSRITIHRPKMLDCMRRGGVWSIAEKIGKTSTVQMMLAAYRGRTKRPRKIIRKWIEEERRFTAAEAVAEGLCDAVMSRYEFEKGGMRA